MENLIFKSLDRLEVLEKEHGMLGTVIGILVLLVSTVLAINIILFVFKYWMLLTEWSFELMFKGWKFI